MLRFSKKIDYSLILVAEMFFHPDEVVSSVALSNRLKLPGDLVSNLLKKLTKCGFVRSVRGKNGGYQLCLQARDMNLMELVEAVEGPIYLTECCENTHCCEVSGCRPRDVMIELSQKIQKMFEEIRIPELVGGKYER